jgi:hypothetical protein
MAKVRCLLCERTRDRESYRTKPEVRIKCHQRYLKRRQRIGVVDSQRSSTRFRETRAY